MQGFNLRSIKTVDSFDLPIKDQDGMPTGVVFTLAGPTHPARKAVEMAHNRRYVRAMHKGQTPDPAEAEATRAKDLSVQTLGWTGYVDESGQPVPFSTQAAKDLYSEPQMQWLIDQVVEGLGNRALYTKGGAVS